MARQTTIITEVRRLISVATELLIAATDLIDGDPDREEDDAAEESDPGEESDPAEDDGTAEPEDHD